MNDDVNVRVALEHANYRRLQESYPQGDGLRTRRTHRRLSDEEQFARAWESHGTTVGKDASFQEWTPSWQTPRQQVSSPEDIEVVLSSQQQHLVGSASRPLPQLMSQENRNQGLVAPTQFRSAGSHQVQESFQHALIHSETAEDTEVVLPPQGDSQPLSSQRQHLVGSASRPLPQQVDQGLQSSSGLPHQKIAPQLPPLEQRATKDQGDVERPIMYTYYEKAVTDMTDDADASLLENWKKAWFDAGWEPYVLNESDARGLPEFDALVELVVDPKHIGTYNMACK